MMWQCSVWVVPTALLAVPGVIEMFASPDSHVLDALPLPPGPGFDPVVRVIVCPLTGMFDVACTTVVPEVFEVIVTVQLAVAAPPV